MKKIALALGLCLTSSVTLHTASTTKEEISVTVEQLLAPLMTPLVTAELGITNPAQFALTLVRDINAVSISFLQLPFWAQMRNLGYAAFGTIAGNISAVALLALVGYKEVDVNIPYPNKWGKLEWLGTLGGATGGFVYGHRAEYPSGITKQFDINLLTIILKNNNTPDQLKKDVEIYFAAERFPNMAAFIKLEKLSSGFEKIMGLLNNLENNCGRTGFSPLKARIEFTLKVIRSALITIKSDPRWLQECSAHTLMEAQQGLKNQQKGEFAAAIVNLANSRR